MMVTTLFSLSNEYLLDVMLSFYFLYVDVKPWTWIACSPHPSYFILHPPF